MISSGESLSRKACVHQLIIDHVKLLLGVGREVAWHDLADGAIEVVSALISAASSARVHKTPLGGLQRGLEETLIRGLQKFPL